MRVEWSLRYSRLRGMVTLVVAVAYFAAVYLGRRTHLRLLTQLILRSAKRIYEVPEFRFYAVADGIKQLLYSSQRSFGPPILQPGKSVPAAPLRPLTNNGENPDTFALT